MEISIIKKQGNIREKRTKEYQINEDLKYCFVRLVRELQSTHRAKTKAIDGKMI